MKNHGGQKGRPMEGIKIVGLRKCWICGELIFRKILKLLRTSKKLGCALHEKKNGIVLSDNVR
jgi:hypothetical protein